MHKKAFRSYARAFGNLLDCARGAAPGSACIEGWIGDASALLAPADLGYARSLIGYYLDNYLRHPSRHVLDLCTAP